MNRILYVNYISYIHREPGVWSSCGKDASSPAVILAMWAFYGAELGVRERDASFLQEASRLPSGAGI